MRKVKILETTLRDGSYAINFTFTAADTAALCVALEESGFEYIEIGHGVGLNASRCGHGEAVQSDEEYMVAAEGALRHARYGMFCIPGIARLEDLDLAARHKMGFVRVGTNVTEVAASEPFIRRAKELGLFVAANYMKSYAMPPEAFARQVELSCHYGADMVYIVDSAGGMFQEDLESYYSAIRVRSDIPIGFHGHDNLGLAVANSLVAAELGAAFVDSSLQGLGRSSGNAATEIVTAALMKRGYDTGINFLKILHVGQQYVRSLLRVPGRMPLDIVSGYAEFHSSYMHHIQKYAAKYNVSPELLILEICKIDKMGVDERILDQVARRIHKSEGIYLAQYDFSRYVGHEQDGCRKAI